MNIKEMVIETVESGITPVRLVYDVIYRFDEQPLLLRTFLKLETLDLGMLTYRQYRYVARRTKQGDYLVARHIDKVCRDYPNLLEVEESVECVTIPVYARLLRGGLLASMFEHAFSKYPHIPRGFICVELSADILYEDIEDARERIRELRELGLKIAICEVGDQFCPVFRLSELAFDYAFVDPYAEASLIREDAERVAGSLAKFLHYLGAQVIAPDLESVDHVAGAKAMEFDGYGLIETRVDELEEEASRV